METNPELLTAEEVQLLETCKELKDKLVLVSSERMKNLEETRRQARKAEGLKNRHKNNQPGNSNAGEDEGVAREDAVFIFPEEVWLIIFGKVSDPKDLWNLCNATPYFDNILYAWKTGWMLGQALPYFYHRLPLDKLLGCRRVCKSWDAALNNFFEEHPSIRPHNRDNFHPQRLDFVDPMAELGLRDDCMAINLTNLANPSIPIQSPEIPPIPRTPGRSPFIGRYLVLDLAEYFQINDTEDEDEQIQSLLGRLTNFLTEVGKEIWYLRLWFPSIGFTESLHPAITQFITADLFRLLPNLRELNTGPPVVKGFFDPLPDPESLPPAPKLEAVHSYHFINFDPITGLLLKRYHAQLRKLALTVGSEAFEDFFRLEWPSLNELYLTHLIEPFAQMVKQLPGLRMSKLSKLGLNLVETRHCLTFHNLIKLIRELSTTTVLNTVRLDGGPGFHRLSEGRRLTGDDERIPLPASIKTLELEWAYDGLKEKAPNYDFILTYFPLVENIHLFLNLSSLRCDNEIKLAYWQNYSKLVLDKGYQELFEIVEVNRYAYRGEMYRSNIWELFHNLKVFTFQWDVYTRHEYEEVQEKRKRNSASVVPAISA